MSAPSRYQNNLDEDEDIQEVLDAAEAAEEPFEDIIDDFDDEDLAEEEFELSGCGEDAEENKFDQVIGKLEDIIMDDEFHKRQENFFKKNCHQFEDTEENKLVYTEIFKSYISWVETHINEALKKEIEGFSMEEFMAMLMERKDEVECSDIFEVLSSLADFMVFKEIMLSYKQACLGQGLAAFCVDVRASIIHKEEVEEGEEMPDLNLSISPAATPSRSVGSNGGGYLGSPMKDI